SASTFPSGQGEGAGAWVAAPAEAAAIANASHATANRGTDQPGLTTAPASARGTRQRPATAGTHPRLDPRDPVFEPVESGAQRRQLAAGDQLAAVSGEVSDRRALEARAQVERRRSSRFDRAADAARQRIAGHPAEVFLCIPAQVLGNLAERS